MNNLEKNHVKRNYTTLWVMILLFALPYMAATYFYLNQDAIVLPASNYGELVVPVRQISDVSLTTLNNERFSFSDVKGKWVLLTIGDSTCEQSCQENLYKIRQIRKAVGQERGRIERVFLLTNETGLGSFNEKLAGYAGMTVALAAEKTHADLLGDFAVSATNNSGIIDGIYIIDPRGDLMMAYPSGADAQNILKDVRRLLKVSKIG